MTLKISGDIRLSNEFQWNETIWNPSMLGPAVWLDAADSTTITASSGNVSQWNDKSGNARNLTTLGGSGNIKTGTRSLNGKNVLDFPGTANLSRTAFSTTSNNGWAWLIAATDQTSFSDAGFARIANIAMNGTDNRLFLGIGLGSSPSNRFLARLSSFTTPQDISAASAVTTSPYILNFGRDFQSNGVLYIDGFLQGENTPNLNQSDATTQNLLLGGDANSYLDGYIGEFILLKQRPTTTVRQRIEGYLAWKWGLTANLPAGHPYKTVGPTP